MIFRNFFLDMYSQTIIIKETITKYMKIKISYALQRRCKTFMKKVKKMSKQKKAEILVQWIPLYSPARFMNLYVSAIFVPSLCISFWTTCKLQTKWHFVPKWLGTHLRMGAFSYRTITISLHLRRQAVIL